VKKFDLELTENAQDEFEYGIDYYNSVRPGLGNRFRRAVYDVLHFVEKNPFLFQKKIQGISGGVSQTISLFGCL
jgi:ABC-type iron transport system FetAB ATPase subunit